MLALPYKEHTISHAQEKRDNFFTELLKFALIALIIVVPVRLFVAQPFIVSGASMEPTFETGQYLIVDELTYHFEAPQRGDVIIFRYPKDPSQFFIKRIIGLPGETVTIKDGNSIRDNRSARPFTSPSRTSSTRATAPTDDRARPRTATL